ncbi:MAG: hypothetical protein HY376_02000 [Candidatus Blackburnbacteria bacterium]|nr:hypothetical protein [Candidatus Blackburnbacteria bacterium]
MCRLCYIPTYIDGVDYVRLFDYLEKSLGGHGNGIGGFVNGQPYIQKGVWEKNMSLYCTARETHFDRGFLYHTRLASFGAVCDYNTHPFEYNQTITCHNGTWTTQEVDYVKETLIEKNKMDEQIIRPMNDSRLIAMLIGTWGFKQAKVWKPGVVLTLTPKHCMAYVGGSLDFARFGNCYLYASDIPDFIEQKADEVKSFAFGSTVELHPTSYKILDGGQPTKKTNKWKWGSSNVWFWNGGKWSHTAPSKEEEVSPALQSTLTPITVYDEAREKMNHGQTSKERKAGRRTLQKMYIASNPHGLYEDWKEWYQDEEEKRDGDKFIDEDDDEDDDEFNANETDE